MSATVIDGRAIAAQVRAEVADEVAALVARGHRAPGLATILIGDDAGSAGYVASKQRACAQLGMETYPYELAGDSSQEQVIGLLDELNADPKVSGILLQLPTPEQIDGPYLTTLIDAAKDVDGLTPLSTGLLDKGLPGLRPCTPAGCLELLRRHDVALDGAEAVVVGRSELVGKPMAALLLAENATVTSCHSHTRDLAGVCRRADVLVVAAGSPGLIGGDWIKPGAAVIDVGNNRTENGLVGDVDYAAAAQVAGLITPVPGGVGPMTIAMLMRNTLLAARAQHARG